MIGTILGQHSEEKLQTDIILVIQADGNHMLLNPHGDSSEDETDRDPQMIASDIDEEMLGDGNEDEMDANESVGEKEYGNCESDKEYDDYDEAMNCCKAQCTEYDMEEDINQNVDEDDVEEPLLLRRSKLMTLKNKGEEITEIKSRYLKKQTQLSQ